MFCEISFNNFSLFGLISLEIKYSNEQLAIALIIFSTSIVYSVNEPISKRFEQIGKITAINLFPFSKYGLNWDVQFHTDKIINVNGQTMSLELTNFFLKIS